MTSFVFDTLDLAQAERVIAVRDRASGLSAFIVLHDLTLGPGAGGVRTRAYPSEAAALDDACRLARAMTLKCSLAGLPAGGAKAVVLDHPGLDRRRGFERLGAAIEDLGGLFRTAGDLGTTRDDLEAMARRTRHVHTEEATLAASVGRGMLRSVEAVAAELGREVAGLTVAIQGAGSIGAAVARALAAAGARIRVADLEPERARRVARETDGETLDPAAILLCDTDVLAPCAVGGVLTPEVASALRARAVCGAANNILASPEVATILKARNVLHVPDWIASAGAVIDGIGRTLLGLTDRTELIDRLGATAREVLATARQTGQTAQAVAEARALARIAAARPH